MTEEMEDDMPAKSKKTDTVVIVAIIGLVGTVIAALFSSPVLIALLERKTPVPGSSEASVTAAPSTNANKVLVFNQDFENDSTSGFAFDGGDWKISNDKSNKVLEGIADKSEPDIWPMATFGPSDFANGIVEFKIKFSQLQDDTSASLHFRYTREATYSVTMMPSGVEMGYRDSKSKWTISLLSEETSRPFTFTIGTWYVIRVEAYGDRFSLYIDDNRMFSASDDRLQRGLLILSLAPGYRIMIDDVKVWSLE